MLDRAHRSSRWGRVLCGLITAALTSLLLINSWGEVTDMPQPDAEVHRLQADLGSRATTRKAADVVAKRGLYEAGSSTLATVRLNPRRDAQPVEETKLPRHQHSWAGLVNRSRTYVRCGSPRGDATIGTHAFGSSMKHLDAGSRWHDPEEVLSTKTCTGGLNRAVVARGLYDDFEIDGGICFLANGSRPFIRYVHRDALRSVAQGGLETGRHLFDKLADFWPWLRMGQAPRTVDDTAWRRACAARPAVVIPIAYKADNHMHALHRAVSVARVLRSEYGTGWRDNVTVVYALLPSSELNNSHGTNAYATFARYLSRQWIVVPVGRSVAGPDHDHDVCFESARVVRWSIPGKNGLLGPSRALFTWHGNRRHRDILDAKSFRDDFAESHGCQLEQVPEQPARTDQKLKVVIAWRSKSRTFLFWDRVLPGLRATALEMNLDLVIVEHIHLTPQELIRNYADADILIGAIGCGLLWSLLMAPGSVVVEIAGGYGCSAGHSGWNKLPTCDYGGNARAAGQQHLSVSVPAFSMGDPECVHQRTTPVSGSEECDPTSFFVPLLVWRSILRAAVCKLASCDATCDLESPLPFRREWDVPPRVV